MGGFNADLQSFGCFEDLFDSTGGISVFVVSRASTAIFLAHSYVSGWMREPSNTST